MEKILVSKCLLGAKVRYFGGDALCNHPIFQKWAAEGRLVGVCPEVLGGGSVPRPAAEIVIDDGRESGGEAVLHNHAHIQNSDGSDATKMFIKGAEIALKTAQRHHIKIAILKEESPSCGIHTIYDGNFNHKKIHAAGVTAALLLENHIEVFDENEIEKAEAFLRSIDPQYKQH